MPRLANAVATSMITLCLCPDFMCMSSPSQWHVEKRCGGRWTNVVWRRTHAVAISTLTPRSLSPAQATRCSKILLGGLTPNAERPQPLYMEVVKKDGHLPLGFRPGFIGVARCSLALCWVLGPSGRQAHHAVPPSVLSTAFGKQPSRRRVKCYFMYRIVEY